MKNILVVVAFLFKKVFTSKLSYIVFWVNKKTSVEIIQSLQTFYNDAHKKTRTSTGILPHQPLKLARLPFRHMRLNISLQKI